VRKNLLLRGTVEFLSRAITHIGLNQSYSDYSGKYMDTDVQSADRILREALWHTQRELEKC
jgi:hypothetical protein